MGCASAVVCVLLRLFGSEMIRSCHVRAARFLLDQKVAASPLDKVNGFIGQPSKRGEEREERETREGDGGRRGEAGRGRRRRRMDGRGQQGRTRGGGREEGRHGC